MVDVEDPAFPDPVPGGVRRERRFSEFPETVRDNLDLLLGGDLVDDSFDFPEAAVPGYPPEEGPEDRRVDGRVVNKDFRAGL